MISTALASSEIVSYFGVFHALGPTVCGPYLRHLPLFWEVHHSGPAVSRRDARVVLTEPPRTTRPPSRPAEGLESGALAFLSGGESA
jgi:hypothetical protein